METIRLSQAFRDSRRLHPQELPALDEQSSVCKLCSARERPRALWQGVLCCARCFAAHDEEARRKTEQRRAYVERYAREWAWVFPRDLSKWKAGNGRAAFYRHYQQPVVISVVLSVDDETCAVCIDDLMAWDETDFALTDDVVRRVYGPRSMHTMTTGYNGDIPIDLPHVLRSRVMSPGEIPRHNRPCEACRRGPVRCLEETGRGLCIDCHYSIGPAMMDAVGRECIFWQLFNEQYRQDYIRQRNRLVPSFLTATK